MSPVSTTATARWPGQEYPVHHISAGAARNTATLCHRYTVTARALSTVTSLPRTGVRSNQPIGGRARSNTGTTAALTSACPNGISLRSYEPSPAGWVAVHQSPAVASAVATATSTAGRTRASEPSRCANPSTQHAPKVAKSRTPCPTASTLLSGEPSTASPATSTSGAATVTSGHRRYDRSRTGLSRTNHR